MDVLAENAVFRQPPFTVIRMLRAKLILLVATLTFAVSPGRARISSPQPAADPRHIDASAFGQRVDISSTWLFSPTDAPVNASPTLDDQSWTTISPSRELTSYGFQHLGIGWFRLHVMLPPNAHNVDVSIGTTLGEYQVFANGIQVGGPAELPPSSKRSTSGNINFAIPESVLSGNPGDLILAFRSSLYQAPKSIPQPRLSDSIYLVSADAAPRDASYRRTHGIAVSLVVQALCCLTGLVSLLPYAATSNTWPVLSPCSSWQPSAFCSSSYLSIQASSPVRQ
jgi:hypothetical protein